MNASTYRSAVALAFAASLGCGGAPALPTGPATPPAAEAPVEKEKPIVAGVPGEEMPEDETPVTDIPRKFNSHDPIQGRRSRRQAQGTNALGLGTTAAAGFYAKHEMMIIAIDHANQLYNPQHDFEFPKTQESFMKDVVAPALNGQPLPKIPEDEEYCYVPEQGEVGLQIRLVPGSPRSKVAAGTTPQQAIAQLGGSLEPEEPAYVPPTTQISPPPADPATTAPAAAAPAAEPAPGEPEGGRDDAGNPLDLRERAAGFGGVSPTDGLSE